MNQSSEVVREEEESEEKELIGRAGRGRDHTTTLPAAGKRTVKKPAA